MRTILDLVARISNEVGSTKLVKDLDRMVIELNSNSKWVNKVVTLEQIQHQEVLYAERKARAEGRAEGEDRMAALFAALNTAGRKEDAIRAATDKDYRQLLYKELGI